MMLIRGPELASTQNFMFPCFLNLSPVLHAGWTVWYLIQDISFNYCQPAKSINGEIIIKTSYAIRSFIVGQINSEKFNN